MFVVVVASLILNDRVLFFKSMSNNYQNFFFQTH